MMKTIRSNSLSKTFPVGKRTRHLLCLITAFLVVSGAAGNLFASEIKTGKASWYSTEACTEPHKKIYTKDCLTSNGESLYDLERAKQYFAASWNYPMGSILQITNLRNSKSVRCRVVDRGPSKRLGRIVDLSKSAFLQISPLTDGVIRVKVQLVQQHGGAR
jgi:rare lipoprotein A